MNLYNITKDDLTRYTSPSIRKKVENTGHKNMIRNSQNTGDHRYRMGARLVEHSLGEMFNPDLNPMIYKTRGLKIPQDEINQIIGYPNDYLMWPDRVGSHFRSIIQESVFTPCLTVLHIISGFSCINHIAKTGTSPPAFERLESAEALLQLNVKHKHALLRIAPNKYIYITNQWEPENSERMDACLYTLFKDSLQREHQELATELTIGLLTDAFPTATLIKKLSNIIIDESKLKEELRNKLQNMEKFRLSEEVEQLKRLETLRMKEINDIEIELTNLWRGVLNVQRELQGLLYQKPIDNDDLFYYIQSNKHIMNTALSDSKRELTMDITTPLEYYDRSAFENGIKSIRSKWWEYPNFERTILALAICFLSDRFQILTASNVTFDLVANTVKQNNTPAGKTNIIDLPSVMHPHIMGIGCFGNNRPYITKALANKNYVQAIEQTVSACKNINMVDRVALGNLIDYSKGKTSSMKYILDTKTEEMYSTQGLLDRYEPVLYNYCPRTTDIKPLFTEQYERISQMIKELEEL